MRELLAREVPGLAFVEVYFGYGMHGKTAVAYFLGQVVADKLLVRGVEAKAGRQPGLITASSSSSCCCYCSLLLLPPAPHLVEASNAARMIGCWRCHDLHASTLNCSTSNLSSSSSSDLVVDWAPTGCDEEHAADQELALPATARPRAALQTCRHFSSSFFPLNCSQQLPDPQKLPWSAGKQAGGGDGVEEEEEEGPPAAGPLQYSLSMWGSRAVDTSYPQLFFNSNNSKALI